MISKKLGRRIVSCRKEMGLTQEQLAEMVDVTVSFMGHMERGTRCASLPTLVRLCWALGVTADELLQDCMPPAAAHGRHWSGREWLAAAELLDTARRLLAETEENE